MKTTRISLKSLALGTCSAFALMGASQAAAAEFAVAPQELRQALQDFASQGDQQVLFSSTAVAGKRSNGFSGSAAPEAALGQLLAGTGLSWSKTAEGALLVKADADPQSGSAAGGGAEVEALIVTAQKREEDIQDVPIAISAFSQEDLTRSQVAGGPDLITQVPNMTFTKTNFSSYSIQLRGIGTQAISATTDPAVAVAFNNTPFIRNRFFEQEFYDLQRVEVLRGPQGTLYGRNATAGVVNIISQKPKFVAESKLSGDVGNFSSSRVEGMINIPLVEDKVALRLAGAWTKREGYSENELTGNPIDGRDLWSTRLSLRIRPNDRIDANLIWEHFQENDDRLRSGKQLCKKHVVTNVGGVEITDYFQALPDHGQAGAAVSSVQSTFSQGCERASLYSPESFQTPNGQSVPYYYQLGAIGLPRALMDPYVSTVQSHDLRVIESTIDPTYGADSDIGELQLSFDLTDTLTLTSETAYGVDGVYSLQDFNRFNTAPGAWRQPDSLDRPGVLLEGPNGGIFCDPQLGCSDRLVAVDISTAKSRQFSQELRLASDYDGAFNFSLGANYLRADSEDKYYVFINSLSLIAAKGTVLNSLPAYVPNVTDNIECMQDGYLPGDPNGVYAVTGCVYIDPNPIGSVNDEGHNYFLSKNPYKLISYAVFGEAYYQVTDALKITAGLRWTVDKKDAPRIPTWILASNSVGYPVAEVIEQEWREPTGRLTIDWKPDLTFTDETLLYASYAHGYKAGGANPPGFVRVFYRDASAAAANTASSATRPKVFEPEFLDAYELGAKNTLADGEVTMNLAAFYYDYKGYQVSEIVDRSAFNRNFNAEVWGVEMEADWRPLENLRLGLKGGYEKTRLRDGERAVDLMDRTAGMPGWSVVRPFPTYASSCILPTALYMPTGGTPYGPLWGLGGPNGGGPGGCEYAYIYGYDPGTEAPYGEPVAPGQGAAAAWPLHDYPGFDPSTAPNNGEGFFKELGGNELPNAPNWTWTITGDYTIPLQNDWLATLHTDLHWQSESWWRVFNDHEYNKLDEYFTMNLAAIFTNEERGWNIMAYIKNVTDETAITGAFLNSDDTGLTTNVFLTEPRLYGLRVTKAWTGGSTLGGLGVNREGAFPLTIELGGQLQRHEAPNQMLRPQQVDAFVAPFDIFDDAQANDLDWGDGREVTLTWRPQGARWSVSGQVRYGRTNASNNSSYERTTDPVCAFGGDFAFYCDVFAEHPTFGPSTRITVVESAFVEVYEREEHTVVDFKVGYEVGLGGLDDSTVSAGIRYANLESTTDAELRGIPHWNLEPGFYLPGAPTTRTIYDITSRADREFKGVGPVLTWEATFPILDMAERGKLNVAWSLQGGVLFGDRESSISQEVVTRTAEYGRYLFTESAGFHIEPPYSPATVLTSDPLNRTSNATVPTYGATLGLTYDVGAFKMGAGYRWERYVDAIDGGYTEEEDVDRTIDGPYFKVSMGFGG